MTCFGNKYRSACHMNIERLTLGENLTMRLLALALAKFPLGNVRVNPLQLPPGSPTHPGLLPSLDHGPLVSKRRIRRSPPRLDLTGIYTLGHTNLPSMGTIHLVHRDAETLWQSHAACSHRPKPMPVACMYAACM